MTKLQLVKDVQLGIFGLLGQGMLESLLLGVTHWRGGGWSSNCYIHLYKMVNNLVLNSTLLYGNDNNACSFNLKRLHVEELDILWKRVPERDSIIYECT